MLVVDNAGKLKYTILNLLALLHDVLGSSGYGPDILDFV